MSAPSTDPRVDELRRRLHALGYLNSGVDRFVLGPARARRRPAAIAMLVSVRIGVLAALLLGPAAAIGVSGRLPGLVTGARDALMVAAYLGVLFGAAASIVAFVASLIVSVAAGARVARRARPLSIAAGGVVSATSLVYLTLWWDTANAGLGWSAPTWTAFALLVAVAISLLLGHTVRVTALAVMVSGQHGPDDPSTHRAGASWPTSLAAGALAFAGAAALLVVSARFEARADASRPPLTVVSAGLRVRVIAIDGFDPGVFDALVGAGRLPALGPALGGARGRLAADATRDPARVWTTIATGQPPERHGVRGLETRRLAGVQGTVTTGGRSSITDAFSAATDLLKLTSPAVASGSQRREKTFWEVASDAGLRTGVVNWWATWPAPGGTGADDAIVLSDRTSLRLERGGALDAEISPAALYDSLRPRWRALRDAASARAAQSIGPLVGGPDVRAVLQRSAELDAVQIALTRDAASRTLDLTATYLPGLDIAQQALLATERTRSPSLIAARLDALDEYYVCLDRLLGDALRPAAGELVIVITEPGRLTTAGDGLIGLSGTAARRDAVDTGRSTDVLPTILHMLGVPLSQELAGTPLTSLMTDEFVRRYPVRAVARYGPPSTVRRVRTGPALDQEALDRLRSLGYIK